MNRFQYTKKFSEEIFNFPAPVYRVANDVSFRLSGMFAQYFDEPTYQHTARCVLEHIIQRTLQFNKVAEFIRIKDIIEGYPQLGVTPVKYSGKWVRATLKRLVEVHAIFRVQFSRKLSVTPMYGINLFTFLSFIDDWWRMEIRHTREEDEYGEGSTILVRRDQAYLGDLCGYFKPFEKVFKNLTMMSWRDRDPDEVIDTLLALKPKDVDRVKIVKSLAETKYGRTSNEYRDRKSHRESKGKK